MTRGGTYKLTLLAWAREPGGAERQIVNLACGLRRRGHDVLVVVFFPNPYVETPLRETGTPYRLLDVRGRWDAWRYLVRLLGGLWNRDHHVVYGFLQAPNLLTLPLKLMRGRTKVVWGLRNSDLRPTASAASRLVGWLESRLSGLADLVVANSFRGSDDAVALGFDRSAITVIHNGIDTEAFRPHPEGGVKLRAEWGIPADAPLIGLVGRLDVRKDHDVFLNAAAIAARGRPDLRFVCVGDGPAAARARLEAQSRTLGLQGKVVWAGFQWNMPAVYAALDVVTLSSACGEGFPNIVGEAMACGRLCVVTDVGDAALIVGELGLVVPPRNPQAMADAWVDGLAHDTDAGIQRTRRRRIEEQFNLDRMLGRTEQALGALLDPQRR